MITFAIIAAFFVVLGFAFGTWFGASQHGYSFYSYRQNRKIQRSLLD